jgi:hypothetical protein
LLELIGGDPARLEGLAQLGHGMVAMGIGYALVVGG